MAGEAPHELAPAGAGRGTVRRTDRRAVNTMCGTVGCFRKTSPEGGVARRTNEGTFLLHPRRQNHACERADEFLQGEEKKRHSAHIGNSAEGRTSAMPLPDLHQPNPYATFRRSARRIPPARPRRTVTRRATSASARLTRDRTGALRPVRRP